MSASALAKQIIVWLSKEEQRLLDQKEFIEKIQALGGFSSINEAVSIGIQSDLEDALQHLGDIAGYLEGL